MSKYIDLVLVNKIMTRPTGVYLYQAPAFTNLEPGTEVKLEGGARGSVLCSITKEKDSETANAIRLACGADEGPLPKVIGHFKYRELDYGED